MATELDVLGFVSDRLIAVGVPFMLTGPFALAYYATPRMTRDLDIVVSLEARDVDPLVKAFAQDSISTLRTRCRDAAAALEEGLVNTWPVLTKAVHFVSRWLGVEPSAPTLGTCNPMVRDVSLQVSSAAKV
jgi:hypothetical protein